MSFFLEDDNELKAIHDVRLPKAKIFFYKTNIFIFIFIY